VQELEQQKSRLATYEVQARFALATMYDRAATAGASRGKAPAPVQKGAEAAGSEPAGSEPAGSEPAAEPAGDAGDDAPAPQNGTTPPATPEPPR